MPRCDCAGTTCQCLVRGGEGIEVTGAGTALNPYVVSATGTLAALFRVVDTDTVDLETVGAGTEADPFILSANARLGLNSLLDVDAPTPGVGDTISWDGNQWVSSPPIVAPAGATNTSGGIIGIGSPENPVRAAVSGVWGTGPLAGHGDDSTVGQVIYVDANGQLRAEPLDPATMQVPWSQITGRPSTFPSTWEQVTGKPSSWPTQVVSSGVVTATSGWRLDSQVAARSGNVVSVRFQVTRTGGAISANPNSGNFAADPVLATLAAGWRPAIANAPMVDIPGDHGAAGGSAKSNGDITVSWVWPVVTVNTGHRFMLGGTWVVGG